MPGGCAAFLRQFSELLYFCVGSFNSPMPLLGRFYQYLHIFAVYYANISSKNQTVFWAQNFRDVQLIPNFFKISSLSLILQFLEGTVGNKLPNRWILTDSNNILTNFL